MSRHRRAACRQITPPDPKYSTLHETGQVQTTTVIHDVAWLQERHDWPGLKAVVMVESTQEIAGKIEQETRFYITSLVLLANLLGPIIRSHWAIENSLHWVLDMVFRDDEGRVRTDHAPASFATISHMAQNLIRKAQARPPCGSSARPPDGMTTSSQS